MSGKRKTLYETRGQTHALEVVKRRVGSSSRMRKMYIRPFHSDVRCLGTRLKGEDFHPDIKALKVAS
jgi:hypothetical protein